MATYTLDFERPLLEIEKQIEELKRNAGDQATDTCLLYTSPSPRDRG